jgi:quercetin dioxygenase-like cupin family protein
VIASWPELTVGKLSLPPSRMTDARRHRGDMSLLVVAGNVTTQLAGDTVELQTNDALYVPEGNEYRLQNASSMPAELVCGVAPRYVS